MLVLNKFSLGWKRELVFKKIIPIHDSVVYYYSPSNQKLRNLAEIQGLLDSNNYGPLSIKNFTFIKKPITISYFPDEFIKSAVSIRKVRNQLFYSYWVLLCERDHRSTQFR